MIITRAAILLLLLLSLLFAYETIVSFMLKMKKPLPAALLVITLFMFIFVSNCSEAFNNSNLKISPALLMGIALVMTAAGLVLLSVTEKWKASQLTAKSIKECVDTLPTGICFCDENGLPVLMNTAMEHICRELIGLPRPDGNMLWDTVTQRSEVSVLPEKRGPIVRVSDGRVYSFTRYEAEIDGRKYLELIASDTTSEYTLTQELREKQARADDINLRLHELNRSIGEVIKERELLQIKINIHDSFGKMLLLTKRSLLVEGSVDQDELLGLWKQNTRLFGNVRSEQAHTPYTAVLRHAEELGVSIRISGGELPTSPDLVEIIDEAITVHVTNVLRHAHGSNALIEVSSGEGGYELRFTNDGAQPESICEKGGLANLRRIVESCGGTMEIKSGGSFEMILRLPQDKGEAENGIQRSYR